jgi:hypothetical protein
MDPRLLDIIQHELDVIRADPVESVGFGDKTYMPYEVNGAEALMSIADPAVTDRLLAEARSDADRAYRLAVLHVLGRRTDATVDDALLITLRDADLRATSAYLLGRPGFKGYPARTRDMARIRQELRQHLEDDSVFKDPFYKRNFRTQDFVLAAFVRLTGPEHFESLDPDLADLIGYSLPRFGDDVRHRLLSQAANLRT